ncbi:hypothetical protein G159_14885 [Planococcus glaciei CHR43]|nr:hypothetical protein G159_14885 [Planococcus glaciei CHR43]
MTVIFKAKISSQPPMVRHAAGPNAPAFGFFTLLSVY